MAHVETWNTCGGTFKDYMVTSDFNFLVIVWHDMYYPLSLTNSVKT